MKEEDLKFLKDLHNHFSRKVDNGIADCFMLNGLKELIDNNTIINLTKDLSSQIAMNALYKGEHLIDME